jgi:signal transduction histidine kinase
MKGEHKTKAQLIEHLEQRNWELEEKEHLLTAFHQMGKIMLSALDEEQILDHLAKQIIKTGIFRSLMIALVHKKTQQVEVVRNFVCTVDGRATPGGPIEVSDRITMKEGGELVLTDRRVIGTTYDLNEDNVTTEVARNGRMQVITGWSDKFDDKAGHPEEREGKVSYFIPVKQDGQVLAVLATGSQIEEKEEILHRIEVMQPLLDQMAIALMHARLYKKIREENTQRKEIERELRTESRLNGFANDIRIRIAAMDQPAELSGIIGEISDQIRKLGIKHDSCTLQIINSEGTDFFSVDSRFPKDWHKPVWEKLHSGTSWPRASANAEDYPWVIEAWKTGEPKYIPCTSAEENLFSGFSVIDMPFSNGTLAINCNRSHAFDEGAIAVLRRFAHVLSDGFQRFLDTIQHRQMELELIRLERFRALGELASGVSHNLNNILTGVLLPAHFLQKYIDDPEILESVDLIVSSAEHARSVIKRLNESVRGQELEEPCAVSIDAVVKEVVEEIRPRWKDEAEAKGIAIEIVTQVEGIPPVKATQAGLHDVLHNLLFNAIEAMPEGGRMTIRAQRDTTGVLLSTTDTGIGMDEETRQRVFEPFFTTKQTVDTGLGMSSAYGMVTRWGGTIQVESALGKGTTVAVSLPVWQDVSGKKEKTEASHRKLLIVEDDEKINYILSQLLSKEYEVEVMVDGREALEHFVPEQFDVVLMDLGLPGLPGDQVAIEMKKRDPAISVILITGWTLEEDDPRLQVFDFHVQKPLRLGEISSAISQAMELHDIRTEM